MNFNQQIPLPLKLKVKKKAYKRLFVAVITDVNITQGIGALKAYHSMIRGLLITYSEIKIYQQICRNFQQGGECKMKTRHGRKQETNTVATVSHCKHCESIQDLLFVIIPNTSKIF